MTNLIQKCNEWCITAYCNFNLKNFVNKHGNLCLFILGAIVLTAGITNMSAATWHDRLDLAICGVFKWLEGGFGALVMIVAGLLAIVTAAMGAYKAAMACLIIAVGTFILRAVVTLFFADVMNDADGQCTPATISIDE